MDAAPSDFASLQRTLAGRFSVERELGRGGMGVVYLARDVALDRPVAIKVLRPDLIAEVSQRERFLREARTAAGLSHPNIVPIHLVEAGDELVCFVMAYVAGETLGDRVRREGPLPATEVARIVREVAWALGYAHGRGVIHRDIKPDNILLEQGTGRAMVTDFGIARASDQGTITTHGEILGTLQYMAPEQADASATVDGRADLYALGVTAFFALTGRLPFEATSAPALLAMHMSEPAPPVTSLRSGIPSGLAEAVGRCLAKEPAARYDGAEALAEALGSVEPAKVTPTSIRDVMSARDLAAQFVFLPGALYFLATDVKPEWAAALGAMWAALGALGVVEFLSAARATVRAGYDPADVALLAGEAADARQTDPSVSLSREQGRKLVRMLVRPAGRFVLGGFGAAYLWFVGGVVLDALHGGMPMSLAAWAGLVLFLAFGVGLCVVALRPSTLAALSEGGGRAVTRTRLLRRVAEKLWDNPVVRGIFRLAGLGIKRRRSPKMVESRPTEMILGRAADDLFDELPRAERERLRDVPDVIRQLERAAAGLRARRDELERAIAGVGGTSGVESPRRRDVAGELERVRDHIADRLRTVVAALEDLRLDLLRLRAGVGDAGGITEVLAEARRVGESIAAELAGRAEVKRVLGEE